jgi:hypothetical protein
MAEISMDDLIGEMESLEKPVSGASIASKISEAVRNSDTTQLARILKQDMGHLSDAEKTEILTESIHKAIEGKNTEALNLLREALKERKNFPHATLKKVQFAPSEVASILGWHKWRAKNVAMYRTLRLMPEWKPLIARVENDSELSTSKKVVDALPPKVKKILAVAVQKSVKSTDPKAVETKATARVVRALVDVAQKSVESTDPKDSEHTAPASLQKILKTISRETPHIPQKTFDALSRSETVQEIVSTIRKERGNILENTSQDAQETKTGTKITRRQDAKRYQCPQYVMYGRIDGMRDGKVLETKSRTHFWNRPPPYDIVQLRCYMKMWGNCDGILLDVFPKHEPRETSVPWSDTEWQRIHQGLCAVVKEIEALSVEDAEKIVRQNARF